MMSADQVERRINFALDSPDFWRGLGIAIAVLVAAAVIRSVIRVIRKPQERPLATGRLAQISGLLSWLMMASAAVGYQIVRLGEPSWTIRLPLTVAGAVLGGVWGWGTLQAAREARRNKKE